MELIRALALSLAEDDEFNGVWPEGAKTFTQSGTETGDFYGDDGDIVVEEFWFSRTAPYIEEYDEGDTITAQQYAAFIAANPNLLQMTERAAQVNVAKIADLNKQVASLVNDMAKLADEAGIDLTINLGQYGSLDPNGDWDSSRC